MYTIEKHLDREILNTKIVNFNFAIRSDYLVSTGFVTSIESATAKDLNLFYNS